MTEAAARLIALDGGDAEVWSWERKITGTCRCPERCGTISLSVNGADVAAERKGRRFRASVRLKEGKNHIVAVCRHADQQECSSDAITLLQRLKNRPTARIQVSIEPEGVVLDGGASSPGEASGAPIVKHTWRRRKGNPAFLSIRRPTGSEADRRILIAPPSVDGEYYVSLKVVDAEGRSDTATTYFVVENGKPRSVRWDTENPAWVEEAVLYAVVPHNFGPHGFHSVMERLGDLEDLGISAIWLSPCNATPTGGHGYDISDYFRLRRDYGTESHFRKLVKDAHARGIRVLMDFVPNHSSIHHRYMKHAQEHGKASAYHDFYDRDEDGHYTYYFNWWSLPNLNYDNSGVRRWMLEAFSYWVRRFDVDGFRVDAPWGVKLRRPDFWPEWRRELKRIKPDLLLLAEASARDPYWFTEGFDVAYDWTDALGRWSMGKVFDVPERIVARLHNALTNKGKAYHEDALICRFLNTNDTGKRFLTRYALDMEKVAAAMLLTLPGLPCIYTGQEVGAEFEPYKTAGPISWEDEHGLRPYYTRLIGLRRSVPALHSREWEILETRSEAQTYAYARFDSNRRRSALVVLNFSAVEAKADVQLTQNSTVFAETGRLVDLLGGEELTVEPCGESAIRIPLRASSARILVPCGDERSATSASHERPAAITDASRRRKQTGRG